MSNERRFYGKQYIEDMQRYYPTYVTGDALQSVDERLHIGVVKTWVNQRPSLTQDPPNRFQRLSAREFSMERNAWSVAFESSPDRMSRLAASYSYRGLVRLKPPFDIVLYSNLIWELMPATIIEFGSLQGGSALWFADQLETFGASGEVHSFELLDKCIHPSARHPRLHFHQADLRDLTSLDRDLFDTLPHPWLVVDDAHENLEQLVPFVGDYLESGDYYVIEDIFLSPSSQLIDEWISLTESLGLVVDSKYTDAFGYNVTCSPNAWFRRMS